MLSRCRRPLLVMAALGVTTATRALAADEPSAPAAQPAPQPTPAPAAAPPAEEASTAPATIGAHRYTLAECLALADRNFPNLWAARARLAATHAQLDEARWTPWFQWNAQANFGILPPLLGTVLYPQPQSAVSNRNISGLNGLQPALGFNVNGVIPLYTFGKIESALDAAEAGVRVSEWDMEKARQQMRMDVRRAFFGLEFARDAMYVATEALGRLDKAIEGIKAKIAKGDNSVGDVDRLRLETFRSEVSAQSLQGTKLESYGLAALRFMTGVASRFDIVDEPLKRPERPLASIVQYLEAARVLRPDVNMARAGVIAREHQAELMRAKLFPDIGLGLGADFVSSPSAAQQPNVWSFDPFNHFYYYFALGARWSLDLLPQAARARGVESQVEETRALERLALGGAMFEVEKAYADAVEAKSREETWDRAEHQSKQWISIVQDHIDLGTWDEKQLMEPLRAYGNARVQHLTALMDYNIALSNLALASGWDDAAPE